MFLVKDDSESREQRIRQMITDDPALAALLSVIHFEWTARRAIIALGSSPNVIIRQKLDGCHGHRAYKDQWKAEVVPRYGKTLPVVVNNWDGLLKAFKLRHGLVHGAVTCEPSYAAERAGWAIAATRDVRAFCAAHGIDIDARLPIRRQKQQEA